jgi:hypothetical protein
MPPEKFKQVLDVSDLAISPDLVRRICFAGFYFRKNHIESPLRTFQKIPVGWESRARLFVGIWQSDRNRINLCSITHHITTEASTVIPCVHHKVWNREVTIETEVPNDKGLESLCSVRQHEYSGTI